MNDYIEVLKKYADFNGRSTRKEYWMFILFNFIIALVLGLIEGLFGMYPETDESVLVGIYQLFIIIPSIAVGIRRMHDVDKSGWYILIPFYNFILAVTDGTKGDNKYGADPKSKVENDQVKQINSNSHGKPIYCGHCGKPMSSDSKFCTSCGKSR